MEGLMFETHLEGCIVIPETTSYLEIFSYSNPDFNYMTEGLLTPELFDDFVGHQGIFTEPTLPEDVTRVGAVRLVLQQNAQNYRTFSPKVLSLSKESYTSMSTAMRLPHLSLESCSCVGPLFWSSVREIGGQKHLQILDRKSDVVKKGRTRGWELILSHDISSGITSGFYKWARSYSSDAVIKGLKACVLDIAHPMLLPVLIFAHGTVERSEIKHRDVRDWLRRIEHAVSMRDEVDERESYVQDGKVDLGLISRDLVECHMQNSIWPAATYMKILDSMEESMQLFAEHTQRERRDEAAVECHTNILARLKFYRKRLEGLESYSSVTADRLMLQRGALTNLLAQKESRLNFQIAGEQRILAHASKQDSTAMKTLSLLGAIFLPGAYLASIMSTTFFSFYDAPSIKATVSPRFWLYWAITIPITLLVVGIWYLWERRGDKNQEIVDNLIQQGVDVDKMESEIMASMSRRTVTKLATWQGPAAPVRAITAEA